MNDFYEAGSCNAMGLLLRRTLVQFHTKKLRLQR
jgi:hypothetical protein